MSNTQAMDCESRLKLAEARLETMSAQIDSWMWETDENHRFTYFTDNVTQLTGLQTSDLLGTSRLEMARSSNDPSWKEHANTLEKQRPFKDFKYVRKTATGEDRYLVTTGWPVLDKNGVFTGYRGTATDDTSKEISGRRQVKKEENLLFEIEKQRTNLSTVIENLSQSVMWFDKFGVIRLNNGQTAELLGFDEREYSKVRTIQGHLRLMAERGDFGDVDVEQEVENRAKRLCLGEDEAVAYRIHLQTTDRFLDVGLRRLPDGSRILTHTDVSIEARKDLELKQREAVLNSLVDNIDYGTLILDHNHKVELANRKFRELMGIGTDFLAGAPTMAEVLDRMYENKCTGLLSGIKEEWPAYRQEVIEQISQGKFQTAERERQDGKIILSSCIKLPGGRRLVTYFDMTEHREGEAALLKMQDDILMREEMLSTVVNNVDQGILLMDADLNVEVGNQKFAELWGMDMQFLEQAPSFRDIMEHNRYTGFYPVDGNDEGAWNQYAAQRVASIKNGDTENLEFVRGDGKTLIFSAVNMPDGRKMTTYFDISDLKDREAQLKIMQNDLAQANELLEERVEQRTKELRQTQNMLVKNERQALLGDLVASLCHELRNPLNALNTSLFLIRRNVESDFPKLTKAFDRSERTIKRCTNILNDLFDYALVDDLKKETITVAPWLSEVVGMVEIPKSFEVILDIASDLPDCSLDPDQLGSGVSKIIANAAQAIADGHDPTANPKIEIYAGDCGDYIEIIISDNGPGMDKETFSRALEPLYSTRGFGVGLGLPIAEQVIKRHGGDIRLETFEGAGTTVTIWLPALDQPLLQVA